MKVCSTCKESKPKRDFYVNRAKKDGRQYFCKKCQNDYHNNKWYKKKKVERVQQVKEYKLHKKRVNYRKVIKDYFSKGCIDCGEMDIRVLEFDHVRGVKKRFKHRRGEGVSFLLMNGYNWETIKKEIDKCEVRCCNCHKLRTYEQFNYLRDMRDITEEYFNKLEQSKK